MLQSRRPSIAARVLSVTIVKASKAVERASLKKPSSAKVVERNPAPMPITQHFEKMQQQQEHMEELNTEQLETVQRKFAQTSEKLLETPHVKNDPLLARLVTTTNHLNNTVVNAAKHNTLPPISDMSELVQMFYKRLSDQHVPEKEARRRALELAYNHVTSETALFNQILQNQNDVVKAEAAVNLKRLEVTQEVRRLEYLSTSERSRRWNEYIHLAYSTVISSVSAYTAWSSAQCFIAPFTSLALGLKSINLTVGAAAAGGGWWSTVSSVFNPVQNMVYSAVNFVGPWLGELLAHILSFAKGAQILATGSIFLLVFVFIYLMLRILQSKKFRIAGLVHLQMY